MFYKAGVVRRTERRGAIKEEHFTEGADRQASTQKRTKYIRRHTRVFRKHISLELTHYCVIFYRKRMKVWLSRRDPYTAFGYLKCLIGKS
jgi:hypothetical protein